MDMTYDGALVMPMDCAMMNEEEMTYLDGGSTKVYARVDALKYLKSSRDKCLGGSVLGLTVGGVTASTVIGAIGGGLAAYVFGNWAEQFGQAYSKVKNEIFDGVIAVKETLESLSLTVTVW